MKGWMRNIGCLAALLMVCACQIDVDLCNEAEHPHGARLIYSFDWDKSNAFVPDSMTVLANRVVNMWKSGMSVNSSNGGGTYLFNAPLDYRPGTENSENRVLEPVTWQTGMYKVPVGEYKFIAFNMEAEELDYTHVYEYFVHPEMPPAELNIVYRTYRQGDSGLHFIIPSWTDYNGYANYIQPSTHALYYDTIPTRKLAIGQIYDIKFSPKELTQKVDIYFNIKKVTSNQKFTVDSVFAEISGLPTKINLAAGSLDIERTSKMMFPTDKIKDTEAGKKVACHAEIHVPGIVRSRMDNVYFGPGIMQVMIYCSAYSDETDRREVKKFQGKINLYNTLTANPSLQLNEEDRQTAKITKHTLKLNIKADMEIDGEKILESSDAASGLDAWKNAKEETNIIDL
ncbi:MAG: hypothetical protein J6I52_10115 [Prevotella sp.]|nr:hypothetical protein [Prevotella sp.]